MQENVAVELDCIWETGEYCFDIPREKLLLRFTKSVHSFSKLVNVEWTREQVNDFIHKLGFLEPNEDRKHKKSTFMLVTEVSVHSFLLPLFLRRHDLFPSCRLQVR